jgi:superfamily II DNA or RNA helicase
MASVDKSLEHVFLSYLPLGEESPPQLSSDLTREVYESWKGCLSVVPSEILSSDDAPKLRQPQVAALFAIFANLTSHEPDEAIVVMPTGTGKTETMLASVCGLPAKRALVIVPTENLRQQTFNKFLNLGKLRELGAIRKETLNPIVALIKGGITTEDELQLALLANVIITTPQSMSYAKGGLQKKLYDQCSHLFIDEAHHSKAPTWATIKEQFRAQSVIQFTATPFREDRKKISGKIIYNYPMSEAQKQGLFRSITFKSVYEVNDRKGDILVAEKTVEQLREDLDNGFDHILMSRCNSRKRADALFNEIYKDRYPDLNPVVIHSSVSKKVSKLAAIKDKKHRIIICVDMLGEGFDLPELKICALHDIHKSLAITLQFAGRFVRDRNDLGEATFVANVCDQQVEDVLKDLYLEDPDWNKVLRRISENSIGSEIELEEVRKSLLPVGGKEMPLENLKPALSTLVYRAGKISFNLDPSKLPLENGEKIFSASISQEQNLLILITKVESKTKWAPQDDFILPEWRLLIAYFLPEQKLLFIHDSSKSGVRKRFAKHLSSEANLLNGDKVFKSFGNVERLILQNAGLNRGKRGLLRYVMYTGTDIESAINDLAQGASYKSNLFGKGYDNGKKVTVGCSHKGRIWSMSNTSILEWMAWCKNLGDKLNDPKVDPNRILTKVLRTKEIESLPLNPITIDWPDYFYEYGLASIAVDRLGKEQCLDEVELILGESSRTEVIFYIDFDGERSKYKYEIAEGKYSIKKLEGDSIYLNIGSSKHNIVDYFSDEYSPSFYFDDGSKVFQNLHIVRPDDFCIPKIDLSSIESYDWTVSIRNESQGKNKKTDSIQYEVLTKLKKSDYWFIFDDDGKNEISDIVAFKEQDNTLFIEFYHLKFSKEDKPGSRVDDLYQVCGQVMKGCKWVGEFDSIIDTLKKREKRRINKGESSRIEFGEYKDLDALKQHGNRLKKEYIFYIIQPGLDTTSVSDDVLYLLGSTDIYVRETTGKGLKVIGS